MIIYCKSKTCSYANVNVSATTNPGSCPLCTEQLYMACDDYLTEAQKVKNCCVKDASEVGRKDDDGKLRFDLIDPFVEEAIVEVLTEGAGIYGDHNWKKIASVRYEAAYKRHMNLRAKGEMRDKKSGKLHSAHANCCLQFLLWFDLNSTKT